MKDMYEVRYTFLTLSLVPCEWETWENGDCTETCGEGSRTRTRECDTECEGECDGDDVQNGVACDELKPCPGKIL